METKHLKKHLSRIFTPNIVKPRAFAAVCVFAAFVFASCVEREQNELGAEYDGAAITAARIFTDAGLLQFQQPIPAPDFSLQMAGGDGETLALSDLHGRVVVLNFWASWCPNCRAEKPSLQALHSRYSDEDLTILAVNVQENAGHVQAYLADNGLTFPVVLDENGVAASIFGVNALPTSFIINREGDIAAGVLGRVDWDSPNAHAMFEYLMR